MVYATDLKSVGLTVLRVRVSPRPPKPMSRQLSTPKIILSHILRPKSLQSGPYNSELVEKLELMFKTKVFLLNSGRSAIFVALKSLGIGQGDEVLLQAYTCNSVPNPVLWTGATPIYVDIEEETLNMDLRILESRITEKSKVIIVQHTFGNPAKIKEILKIAEKHKLKVIEDCAHSLGASVDNKLLGTFGDLAILSFGREKVISGLTGGALLVNDKGLENAVEEQVRVLKPLSKRNIAKELTNYFSWRLLFRKIYSKEWGASFIRHLYQYDLFNVVTSKKELDGLRPNWYPSLMGNIFARIILNEFPKIVSYNERRREIAERYLANVKNLDFKLLPKHSGVYLRVVALHSKAHLVLEKAREQKLNFGNWYNSVVYPESVHLARLGYKSGSCPVAEKIARETVNLPNYLGMSDTEVERVVKFVNDFQ